MNSFSSGYTNGDMYPNTGYNNNGIVAPSGYIELDDSMNKKNVPSRETIMTKEDLSFCFNNYLVPKYGMDNLNVNNVGSFMKELEMNWKRLTPELKENCVDILFVILSDNYDFKNALMKRLSIKDHTISSFGSVTEQSSCPQKKKGLTTYQIMVILLFCVIGFYLIKFN